MKIQKIFEIGVINSESGSDYQVGVRFLDGSKNILITPKLMSNMCIYLYETAIFHCDESVQNEFERQFKEYFDKSWENRENIVPEKVPVEDVFEDE